MNFPQFVIYVLIYDYLKFRKDPSITSQEITNYICVALAVALSVVAGFFLFLFRIQYVYGFCLSFLDETKKMNYQLSHQRLRGSFPSRIDIHKFI